MVAINTDYKNDISSIPAIEEQLDNIAKAGFSHVQWVHDWQSEYMYCDIEMVQIKEMLDKHKFQLKGIHATEGGTRARIVDGKFTFVNRYRNVENRKDYTSLNEYTRLAGVELIKNRVDLAKVIGAEEIILHMQMPWEELRASEEFKEKYWAQTLKSFDELEVYCKDKGIKIAVENVICTPYEDQVEQFDRLFERYDFDFMGFCFDSGHGSITSHDDYLAFARRYQDRIIALHLQDTHGIPIDLRDDDVQILKHDSHMVPFSGLINWEDLMEIVAGSPYKLPITLEVGVGGKDYDEEINNLVDAKIKGQQLNDMVIKFRNEK
ncbi:sugar phosphate isomerase/epimerase [Acidaminobacter sp. JC074]|uniref:sugar phosphate isomerase/epimerase family protein n=1 Tax=Acidaminobacter sp. JC074 TaxID=2530199 RepID=UPI001F115961|nr:sugar phosphate isomerase/epimerase family protein [Acidaminobacter sp. JC074]MCH4886366.1 sugar phosphate isomerase/epimerase [Acidaminobacter sp. JC074]